MVYSCVMLVKGEPIDRNEARRYLGADGHVLDEYESFIHPYRCCSKLAGTTFIKGHIVHMFHRVSAGPCGNRTGDDICGRHYRCDKCLGQTNGGIKRWFDVDRILNELVSVDAATICPYCHDVEYTFGKVCQTCLAKYERAPPQRSRTYYLMLDDCLSCT